MKVLVACEFSGRVRDAFIKRGHDAWSCDLLPTEAPGPHIQGDVLRVLDNNWDLLIAHPPCTYICRQSNRWNIDDERRQAVYKAIWFFNRLLCADTVRVCVENPIPHKVALNHIGQYTQTIQPYQFGHDYSKKTCLWLRNLPELQPTKLVEVTYYTTPNGFRYTKGWYFTPRNSKARSVTFQGIADAMAEQWGYK